MSVHTSNTITYPIFASLQATVMDLVLKFSTLSPKINWLEDTSSSSPVNTVTVSTSRNRTSHTSKYSTLTTSTKDTRHKRNHDTNQGRGTAWDTSNTWESRKRSSSEPQQHPSSSRTWETPIHDTTQVKKQRHCIPPFDDFTATAIKTTDILHWRVITLSSRDRPSARCCARITQIPVALAEHNLKYAHFTTDWHDYRNNKLRNIDTHILSDLTLAQTMTITILAGFLQTTSHLELGYSIAWQGDDAQPQDIWLVTCSLCGLACHLQRDVHHHGGKLTQSLDRIRCYLAKKVRHDKLTHGHSQLRKCENMLNAQELYTHIRLYSDTCFLHDAYDLILDVLYPEMQAHMIP